MAKRSMKTLLLAGLLFALPLEAEAAIRTCDCGEIAPIAERRNNAYAIFSGTVTRIRNELDTGRIRVTFNIHESWKGVQNQTASIYTEESAAVSTLQGKQSCGFPFDVGRTYLVISFRLPKIQGPSWVNRCWGTRPYVEAVNANDVKTLGIPIASYSAPPGFIAIGGEAGLIGSPSAPGLGYSAEDMAGYRSGFGGATPTSGYQAPTLSTSSGEPPSPIPPENPPPSTAKISEAAKTPAAPATATSATAVPAVRGTANAIPKAPSATALPLTTTPLPTVRTDQSGLPAVTPSTKTGATANATLLPGSPPAATPALTPATQPPPALGTLDYQRRTGKLRDTSASDLPSASVRSPLSAPLALVKSPLDIPAPPAATTTTTTTTTLPTVNQPATTTTTTQP